MLTAVKKNVAIATVALGVLGGGAYAVAQTAPARPSLDGVAATAAATVADTGSPAATSAPAGARLGRRALLRRAIHAEVEVRAKGGTFETVDIDRGTLNAVDGGKNLKVDRPDGKQVTVALDDSTRYRGISGAGDLRTGDKIVVVSKDGKALVVAQRKAGSTSPAAGGSQG